MALRNGAEVSIVLVHCTLLSQAMELTSIVSPMFELFLQEKLKTQYFSNAFIQLIIELLFKLATD